LRPALGAGTGHELSHAPKLLLTKCLVRFGRARPRAVRRRSRGTIQLVACWRPRAAGCWKLVRCARRRTACMSRGAA